MKNSIYLLLPVLFWLVTGCAATNQETATAGKVFAPRAVESKASGKKNYVKTRQTAHPEKAAGEKSSQNKILKRFEAAFNNRIQEPVSPLNPSRGPLDAPITIIQYSSFQCPVCGYMATGVMKEVRDHYNGNIRLVFKNYPLTYQKRALSAAQAALAAHKQGKFWEFHNRLYTDVRGTQERMMLKSAAHLGLNIDQFNQDRHSKETAAQIAAETARAAELGFSDVPVFIVNGVVMDGLFPKEYFVAVIDKLLAESEQVGR